MKGYFSYDFDGDGFELWDTAEQAQKAAEVALKYYRDEAGNEGWPEQIETCVMWGEVTEAPVMTNRETKAEYDAEGEEWPYSDAFDEVYDMQLQRIKQLEKE